MRIEDSDHPVAAYAVWIHIPTASGVLRCFLWRGLGSCPPDADFAVLLADLPVGVVDEPVVEPAQVDAVTNVGGSAVAEVGDVVGLAVVESGLAAGPAAAG
jgi:hypothetical protein